MNEYIYIFVYIYIYLYTYIYIGIYITKARMILQTNSFSNV